MIVCVNKMDDALVNYSEERFLEIKKEVSSFLKSLGYKPVKIPFVPASGWTGDNISEYDILLGVQLFSLLWRFFHRSCSQALQQDGMV